jgi:hypothetical protein
MTDIDTRLAEITARESKATKGPWQWFGELKCHSIYLATVDRGREYVMRFVRWGMGSAQPTFQVHRGKLGIMVKASELVDAKEYSGEVVGFDHPDADFVANARQDIPFLLAELAKARRVNEAAETCISDMRTTSACHRWNFNTAQPHEHQCQCHTCRALDAYDAAKED